MASGLKGKVVHVKIVVLHLFPTEIAAEANFKLVVFLNFTIISDLKTYVGMYHIQELKIICTKILDTTVT